MDKKKGFLNVIVSIFFQIVLLVASLFTKRFLIQYIGNEVNGLHSLYTSIIGFLAVAELGVGSAITFCMYKPIVEGENQKVSALYHLFTRLYLIIGAIILICGCILMPFLKYFAKDYAELDVNLYLTFGIMLASVVLTYTFSAKTSLINAYKNNFVTTSISSIGMLLRYGLQIVVLIYTRSFIWYLICAVIAVLAQWIATELIARLSYGAIMRDRQRVDDELKHEIVKSVKAMFMHKIGGVLVNTADSVIISAFIGLVILGKYSNYTTIMLAMIAVINLFFTPLTSVIGHLCVEESEEAVKKYYHFFHTFNFAIGAVFFLGYYAIIDNLVTICFDATGTGILEMEKSVSFVITLNYFIQFMRQATLLFRDATGTFYNDRWKPIVEGVLNIVLSIAFVFWFGIIGVIAATILTNIFICHVVEPHVLHKYALHERTVKYYVKNYLYIVLFAGALVALHYCMMTIEGEWLELLVNGFISVGLSMILFIIALLTDKDFRYYLGRILIKLKQKLFPSRKVKN